MALTNAQYDEIMRGYEQRQTENRHRLELRTKEIYEKEPRLTLLDDEISSTSVSSARLLLSGDEAESQKLRERLTLLQKEKSGLIASLGYPRTISHRLIPVQTARIPDISATNAATALSRQPLI